MHVRQIDVLLHLAAAKGHADNLQWLFQRHTCCQHGAAMSCQLVCIVHFISIPP